MSDLVGNPEDWFSDNEAPMVDVISTIIALTRLCNLQYVMFYEGQNRLIVYPIPVLDQN